MQRERLVVALVALALVAGCKSVDDWSGLKRRKETTPVAHTDDGQVIAGYLATLDRLGRGGDAEQAEILESTRNAYLAEPSTQKRLRYAFVLAVGGFGPLLVWIAQLSFDGTSSGARPIAFHPPGAVDAETVFRTVTGWFIGAGAHDVPRALVLAGIGIVIAAAVAIDRRDRGRVDDRRAIEHTEATAPRLWILLIFGLGLTPAVVYGVLQGFFPICLLVAGGVRDVDRMPILVARSMGATTGQIYWKVILPAVRPAVRAGMRLGIVFCLLGVLVVEMFGGIRGMGFLLTTLANGFQAPELFAATALVSLLSIGIVLALK